MRACTYVGRVGGLAVALGVGAAVLGGTAVSWADDDASTGSAADHTSTQTASRGQASRSGGASTTSGSRGTRGVGAAAQAERPTNDASTAAIPDARPDMVIQDVPTAAPTPVTEFAPAEPAADPVAEPIAAPVNAPSAVTAPTAVPPAAAVELATVAQPAAEPVAAPAAAVAAAPTGTVTALDDPLASTGPGGVPVDTPLDWTVLAYTRRNPIPAASVAAPATTLTTLPIIMGPSGVPIPSTAYGNTVMSYYLPFATPGTQQLLFTPEGLYPITGVKSLPLNTSVDQGLRILSDTLSQQPSQSPVTVFGYSQSAIIASLLQGGYTVNIGGTPTTLDVPAGLANSIQFVMVGDEMNPDGGFLSRFSGRGMPTLTLESLGIPFYGPTPGGPVPSTGVEYPTTVYVREYDGFSDFPRYPINLLADLNAGLGIVYVHVQYTPTISQAECAKKAFCLTQAQVEAARISGQLPSTLASQQYYFIPTENLPLLQPLRAIPFIGNPLADLIQPSLKALVDFGYADPAHGYTSSTQPNANELQPFQFLPPANLYAEAFQRFVDGIGQGIKDFLGNFGPNGSVAQAVPAYSLPNLGPLAMGTTGSFIANIQKTITAVSDYISGAAAGLYAALLPTADIVNALVTTLPAYATNLFLYGIQEVLGGNVIQGFSDAVGLPIAATVGLASMASLVGGLVWGAAIPPIFGQTAPSV